MRIPFASTTFLATICLSPVPVMAAAPSQQQIVNWISNLDQSSAQPAKAIHITDTQAVQLISGEEAFISSVEFENSGRNFWAGYLLTRPALKQSRILPYGGQSNTFVLYPHYRKGKSINLVEFNSAGSGQGAVEGTKTLTVIDGWNIKTLREAEEGSYDGGDAGCKAGHHNQVFFNVMEYGAFIVETSVNANGCDNLTAKEYKVQTRLVPIRF